ncbi:hypothetical protein CRG98_011498 [Punica granatum]|uniref:Uncharacterized protein n=1 Tax=Punica granatum TaxID=22663 RepID=A0A2I0KHA1_PUNGR|nr:hypothetical protein CRG98_011498 [Punica granatum]
METTWIGVREDLDLKDLLNLLYSWALFDVKSQSDFTATILTRKHERGCCLTYDYVNRRRHRSFGGEGLGRDFELGKSLDLKASSRGVCAPEFRLVGARMRAPMQRGMGVSTFPGTRDRRT